MLPCSLARAPLSLGLALRRAPFIVFAKHTPLNLSCYDASVDFSYRYFNDMMAHWSGQTPDSLTRGCVNAKTALPLDFEAYFQDDIDVCLHYHSPLNKAIVEGWQPPQMDSLVHMRKTSCRICDKLYLLGCGAPYDEIELGVSSYRASNLPSFFHPLTNTLPHAWYEAMWEHLPHATFMVANMTSDEVLAPNILARKMVKDCKLEMLQWSREMGCPFEDEECTSAVGDDPLKSLIDNCLRKVRSVPGAECWEFGSVHLRADLKFGLGSLGLMRVWQAK
ncbi:hypothetical protein T492DRAFT_833631 [Pavlovales sp. CCMP2436]|nr:hypothetical protein T492DRAFT_833631 [Pavlovales sp. CCMP2436]